MAQRIFRTPIRKANRPVIFVPPQPQAQQEGEEPPVRKNDLKLQNVPDFPTESRSAEGIPNVLQVDEWFDTVCYLARKEKWLMEDFCCAMILKLPPGYAAVLIATDDADADTPEKIRKIVMDLVCEDYDRSTAFRMLSEITQRPNERIVSYFYRFETLRYLAGLNDDEVTLDMAKQGLHKNITRHLIGKYGEIQNLTDLALHAYRIQQDSQSVFNKPTQRTVTVTENEKPKHKSNPDQGKKKSHGQNHGPKNGQSTPSRYFSNNNNRGQSQYDEQPFSPQRQHQAPSTPVQNNTNQQRTPSTPHRTPSRTPTYNAPNTPYRPKTQGRDPQTPSKFKNNLNVVDAAPDCDEEMDIEDQENF